MYPIYKTLLLAAAMLGINFHAYAQSSASHKRQQIKVSPFRMLDIPNPGIEMGYERYYGGYYSSEVDIGYMRDILQLDENGFDKKYAGWRMSVEQKIFLRPIMEMSGEPHYSGYLSVEFAFKDVSYKNESIFKLQSTTLEDDYRVNKQTGSLNMKWGVQVVTGHVVVDFGAGLGLKYKKIEWEGADYQHWNRISNLLSLKPGSYWTVNFPMNIKVGYLF